jgi:hypothetical protein
MNIFRELKYFIQRGIRGYSDKDLWDFDFYLAEMISRALYQLKKIQHGYPAELTEKKWDKILEDIILGFEAVIWIDMIPTVEAFNAQYPRLKIQRDRGLKLFIKYFEDLWD